MKIGAIYAAGGLSILYCHSFVEFSQDICGVQGSVLVAVKTLTSRDPKDIERFSEEMDLMKKFIHPNIVSFLGMYRSSIHDHRHVMITRTL